MPRLSKQLSDKDAHKRNEAALALAAYGKAAEPATSALIRALWDDNMGVRSAAALALDKIGSAQAKKAIEDYKKEKERQKGGK